MSNNNTTFYELMPNDSHKSFYGKAIVACNPDGSETLYSYGTEIITRLVDGTLVPHYEGWTATTGRHVKAFCGLSKADYFALAGWEKPRNWTDYWDYLDRKESYEYVASAKRLCVDVY